MEDFNLGSTLPPGTITYEERASRTTIDLCLVTVGLVDRVVRSQVDRDLDHDSDHLPISTVMDMRIQQLDATPKRDWKRLDEAVYNKALKQALPTLRRPANKTALDTYVQEIVGAIQGAIDKAIQYSRPSDRIREGWSEECRAVLAEAKRLKRVHSQRHTGESWEAYRAARNHKARTIKKALRNAHRKQVEQAAKSPEALWRLVKWAKTRENPAPVVTPAIQHPETQQEVTDPAKKADIFRDTFFPVPPEADLEDIRNAHYDNQVDMPPVTEKEVGDAIRAASPLKAPASIHTEWGEIRPEATCKYLGLTMDAKLHWKQHTEEIRRKATKTVNALSCLGGSNWGASLHDLRRIYEGTVLPQMMTLNTLQSIQARAARVISGAYKATSRAALDVETFLLPIQQQIWKHKANTVVRLLSSKNIAATSGFQTNTAQPTVADKTRRHTSSWRKVYNDITNMRTQDFHRQEQIPCFLTPPWRQGPTTYIDATAQEARARHDKEYVKEDSLSIYTDGSGIEGEIGSAALCPLTQQARSVHMGSDTESTVYAAELQGISLALQIAQEYASRNGARRDVAIYTDNQAAVWSIAKAEGRSGAYILADIARQVRELQDNGRTVTV
ncbi:pol-like protein [Pyrenophora tritici-repentis]|nr:pol-like protein [Pyrenophora tritici-repentis]KAI1577526.1 pol-like protein [Pyrenophora tritici-repentis]PZC88660.1 RNase-H domain containing protein [Pyrenophora tritici-repentis]